ncbi:ABC transporter permease [Patulibacter sp. SYSU D01012]|uniref:ABC transporter permease n=1 Tax=Patulibacter sp. SYSU D01012 TaxID=2817381 RepID=UPI001B317A84|nr:ABC transporter permease [Patulibacter sp. SYSU D01012]
MAAMVRAELLKLRRSRSVLLGALATVLGLPLGLLAMIAVVGQLPVDGGEFAEKCAEVLLGPGLIGATLIGVAAGSGDRTAGVLPVLAATGRPRGQLLLARIPAVLVATAALSLAFWVVACALGLVLHGGAGTTTGAPALTGAEALDLLPRIVAVDVVVGVGALGLCTAGLGAAPAVAGILALTLGVLPMAAAAERTPDWFLALMPPLSTTELVGGRTFMGDLGAIPDGWAAAGVALWTAGGLLLARARFARADV